MYPLYPVPSLTDSSNNRNGGYLLLIYDIESEPIIISQSLLNIIFKQEHPEDVLAVYIFYYRTAKYQKTNQVWCTVGFISNGIKISENRVREARKILLELNLIEDLQQRSEVNTFGNLSSDALSAWWQRWCIDGNFR